MNPYWPKMMAAEFSWEAQKVKILLIALGVFVMSWFMSCRELRFDVWGKTIDARITVTEKFPAFSADNEPHQIRVNYTFKEPDGTVRRDAALFAPGDAIPVDKIKVQYLAGKDSPTRLAGKHEWMWVSIFGVMTAIMAGFIIKLVREASLA